MLAEQIFAFNAVKLEDEAVQRRVELLESNERDDCGPDAQRIFFLF